MSWEALILAAGEGARMMSSQPKGLHKVGGRSMVSRQVEACLEAGCGGVHLVVSHKNRDLLEQEISDSRVKFHIQAQPLGTADAVLCVDIGLTSDILISNGDHPLMNSKDIKDFISMHKKSKGFDISVGFANLEDPQSFGRIEFSKDLKIKKIIEAKECTSEQLKISSVNTGFYFGSSRIIFESLWKMKEDRGGKNSIKTKEFYLTDIVYWLYRNQFAVQGVLTTEDMAFGVNDPVALEMANKRAYKKKALSLMNHGVRFIDFEQTYIEDSVIVEPDILIYPNVYIQGKSKVGSGSVIEPGVMIKQSFIGSNTYIKMGSYIEQCEIKGDSSIGPYARLREGTVVDSGVKIGNFVETKKTWLKTGVKAGHQCYLGDAEIGENTNIGAGTITCNFAVDGKKYKTKIGKDVFVGSDTQIIPPVTIEDRSVLAAGSVVTEDVEAQSLYMTRAKAFVKKNYRGS